MGQGLEKAFRLMNRQRATPRMFLDPVKYREIKAGLEFRERERRFKAGYDVATLAEGDFEPEPSIDPETSAEDEASQ